MPTTRCFYSFVGCMFIFFGLAGTEGWAQSRLIITLKDSQGDPLKDGVVMIQPSADITIASRVTKRDFAVQQIDREFVPRITVTGVGANVTFPNRDAVQHSVYSFSKAKAFEIPIYAGKSPQTITLDKAGLVTLGCNIHDWMVGYILIVDTPIAELSAADGKVVVSDLPPGKYTLRVWHPQLKSGEVSEPLEVSASEQNIEVKVNLNPLRVRKKPARDSGGY
jgi:plastocyanin